MVNSMNKKILAVVEGEKKEPQLLNRLFDTYMVKKREIVSYGSNLYDLYERLIDYVGDDFESIDFLLFLKDLEPDENKKYIFDNSYTDIFLIFDFDPQDNRFSTVALEKMMEYFSDSTSQGRLYINYPMIESCVHIPSFETEQYLYSIVRKDELWNYKTRAYEESCCPDITKYNKLTFSRCIQLNLKKINHILPEDWECFSDGLYDALKKILDIQVQLLQNNEYFYILNTCLLCIYEYNPRMIEWLDRR